MPETLRQIIARLFSPLQGGGRRGSSSITSKVDDSSGWGVLSNRPHEYDVSKIQELYANALEAWRKNPLAWRIIAITTDYVVGEAVRITSANRALNKFIEAFWHHPKNHMDLRLEPMCDELSRAGDLFVALFRNPEDGMSYIRFVTKDRITGIDTAENDWETELTYTEQAEGATAQRIWLSPNHPQSPESAAVMLHYAINKPSGALMGEGDLTTMIPWLQRYSRMLEDRVRLNWAVRSFLWMVTVPANKVKEKIEQYRTPPESGSIIVKDESETWLPIAPDLHGIDAQHDLRAVRYLIDAGSGYPPHWRGEAAYANLATAMAMEAPTEKHLARRQLYFGFILQDILYHSYQRSLQIGKVRPLTSSDYAQLFVSSMADITKYDNERLGRAASAIAQAMGHFTKVVSTINSPTLVEQMLRTVFKFAGEVLPEEKVAQIMSEINKKPGGEK